MAGPPRRWVAGAARLAGLASLLFSLAANGADAASSAEPRPAGGNSLDSLIKDSRLKFVFVGGKGGVGKTTSSSAIASQLSLSVGNGSTSHRRVLLISTDPAHSLSDAFRMQFSNVPTPIVPDLPNLEVMEVNPTDIMKQELSTWASLAKELGYDPEGAEGEGGIGEKIHGFQEWLSGIPGIDEATALSSAIEHIESGRYDMIVFDTAPTGHTLKLLELPRILQVGLDKLDSWQATLWGYWEMIKGFASGGAAGAGGDAASLKQKVSEKLRAYKASIGRVAQMITDKERTRFVVVCIAEYLSISESRRLLSELDRFDVRASHVVVNQLVTDFLEEQELRDLGSYARSMGQEAQGAILEKALAAAKLTSARRKIQSKYLEELKSCPEVNRQPDPVEPELKTNRKAGTEPLVVLEVPLLPSEVTGPKAILDFSHFLVGKEVSEAGSRSIGVKGNRIKQTSNASTVAKTASTEEKELGEVKEKAKAKAPPGGKNNLDSMATGMLKKVMEDPELRKMIEESPKLQKILQEVQEQGPMAALQYMTDPEVAPFLNKAMGKLMPNVADTLDGVGKKRGRRKGKGQHPFSITDMRVGMNDLATATGLGKKPSTGEL